MGDRAGSGALRGTSSTGEATGSRVFWGNGEHTAGSRQSVVWGDREHGRGSRQPGVLGRQAAGERAAGSRGFWWDRQRGRQEAAGDLGGDRQRGRGERGCSHGTPPSAPATTGASPQIPPLLAQEAGSPSPFRMGAAMTDGGIRRAGQRGAGEPGGAGGHWACAGRARRPHRAWQIPRFRDLSAAEAGGGRREAGGWRELRPRGGGRIPSRRFSGCGAVVFSLLLGVTSTSAPHP